MLLTHTPSQEALQSENEKEETSEGNKCQASHFLIGLFLAAGDGGCVTTRWSFEGGFLRNGNVLTRTISLAVLSPVGNSYPMTSSSKLDGIYIYSEVVFFIFGNSPTAGLTSQRRDPSDSQKPETLLTKLIQSCPRQLHSLDNVFFPFSYSLLC